MKTILFLIVLTYFSFISNVVALEPGFYSVRKHEQDVKSIFTLAEEAERVIDYSVDGFDIGIGPVKDGVRHPKYFTLDDIIPFLESEKHKNLLVVWFDKTIMWGDQIEENINKLAPVFQKIGYRRIVFLGAHCCGIFYLKDIK